MFRYFVALSILFCFSAANAGDLYEFRKDGDPENNITEKEFLKICGKTKYLKTNMGMVATVTEYGAFDSAAAALINEAGDGVVTVKDIYVSKGNQCIVNYAVNGVYKGTTVSSDIYCQVTQIAKIDKSKYRAEYYIENCSK